MTTGQWWVVWNANTGKAPVVQSVTKPATPASGKVFGPYATKAQAEAEANPNSSTLSVIGLGVSQGLQHATNPFGGTKLDWSLILSGFKEWFVRGLKVVFGGILMLLGISHLTGLDNKVTQIAGMIPKVVPV